MIRNLKASGLALCAIFILSALSASAASAANDVLTSGSGSGTSYLTGTQIGGTGVGNVFSTKWKPTAQVECEKATYTGTFAGPSASEAEVTPSFTGCKAGGFNAPVTDNGCKINITGNTQAYTNTSGKAEGEIARVSLNCAHTGSIVADGGLGCTITFKDTSGGNTVNQNLLGIKFDNESDGAKWDLKETVTVDKIHYTTSGCGFLGFTATDNDGFFTTNVTTRAYEDAAHTKQVNLTAS